MLVQLLAEQQAEALHRFDTVADDLRATLGDERFAQARSLVDELRLAEAGKLLADWLQPPSGSMEATATPGQAHP